MTPLQAQAAGFEKPNYTGVPNALLSALPSLSLAELKVILAICRVSFGYHAQDRRLSLSYISKMTGLAHQSVMTGIKLLLERGWIIREQDGHSFIYAVKVKALEAAEDLEAEPVQNLDQAKIWTEPVQNLDRQPGQNLDTLKERTNKPLKPKRESSEKQGRESLESIAAKYPKLIEDATFREALEGFIEHRKKKRAALTPRALELILRKLPQDSPTTAASMLDQSVERGWSGVFELDEKKHAHTNKNGSAGNRPNGFGFGCNDPNDYK